MIGTIEHYLTTHNTSTLTIKQLASDIPTTENTLRVCLVRLKKRGIVIPYKRQRRVKNG